MKLRSLACLVVSLLSASSLPAAAAAKRLLVVSANAATGARHASIPNGEKMLRDLAAKSNGQLALTFMSDAADYPFARVAVPPGSPAGFPGPVTATTAEQQAALTVASAPLSALAAAATAAQTDLAATPYRAPGEINAKVQAMATADANLALARADALAKIQATANKLSSEQVQALAGRGGARGGTAPDMAPLLAKVYQQYLSPAALANYDGVLFLNSAGTLPIPDRASFQKWVSDGHAVVGVHAALDTGYETPDAFVTMFTGGAHFASFPGGAIAARKIYKVDATHPATKDWPDGLSVVDEFYQFNRKGTDSLSIPGLDRTKVHSLLDLDYEGQRLPVAWTRMEGRGRVFYTSLGHRDDLLLPDTPAIGDGNAKVNANNVSAAYQTHLLNGILWALGLVQGDSALGNAK